MFKANLDNDIISWTATGDFPGPEIPDGVPIERLRYVKGMWIDIKDRKTFFIDELGRKHAIDGEGWQKLSCSWDAELVLDGDKWRVRGEEDVQAEARQRLITQAEAVRTALEAAPVTFGGRTIPTDAATLARLNEERVAVSAGEREDGERVVLGDVATAMSNEEVLDAWRAVRARNKSLTERHVKVLERIEAGELTDEAGIRNAFEGAA